MDSSPAEHAPIGAAPSSGTEVGDEHEGASAEDLPSRPIPGHQLVRTIRRLDDPEILQRVLAGLLNLH